MHVQFAVGEFLKKCGIGRAGILRPRRPVAWRPDRSGGITARALHGILPSHLFRNSPGQAPGIISRNAALILLPAWIAAASDVFQLTRVSLDAGCLTADFRAPKRENPEVAPQQNCAWMFNADINRCQGMKGTNIHVDFTGFARLCLVRVKKRNAPVNPISCCWESAFSRQLLNGARSKVPWYGKGTHRVLLSDSGKSKYQCLSAVPILAGQRTKQRCRLRVLEQCPEAPFPVIRGFFSTACIF